MISERTVHPLAGVDDGDCDAHSLFSLTCQARLKVLEVRKPSGPVRVNHEQVLCVAIAL